MEKICGSSYTPPPNALPPPRPKKETHKRWQHYQVDNNGGVHKTVDALTETEAKDELCDAMDLIEKLLDNAAGSLSEAREARYYP